MPRVHAAFLIHVLTASGAALALLAMRAAVAHHWPAMFAWLGVALVVDAVDGPLARRFRVADKLPRWSGETLDLVVDFVTYVFVPAYAIAASGLLTPPFDVVAGLVITITGGLYFADREMKMPGNYFRGFPALWNCIAFYLLLMRPAPWLAAAAVAALAVLTFVPFRFVHPMRVVRLRVLTLLLLAAACVLAAFALTRDLHPGLWVTASLCAIACYMFLIGTFSATVKSSVRG
ncbi:MAG TPA: CDP-alcohol phosphatidyltransferase family protein [Xanthobacteraceae bacterium]|nr:CDP-alcohol phosphatidyltransferase family protein [Xanthobacteraceae bacterium]